MTQRIKASLEQMKKDYILYILLVPVMLFFVIYHIVPMFGMVIAFQDYKIFGESAWVGFNNFRLLLSSPLFMNVLKNTIIISTMKMVIIFPIPIIMALFINSLRAKKLKMGVQISTYLPHFLSWIVITGIWVSFLAVDGGLNDIRAFLGADRINFMTSPTHIRWVLIFSEIWRSAGWDSIIYLAAILKISKSLYEASAIDGASKRQQLWHITLPALIPTIMVIYILNLGFFMSAGFDQVYNFSNDATILTIDIIDTYAYRIGLLSGQYSLSTAAAFFKGAIGFVLIMGSHTISKKISGKGLW